MGRGREGGRGYDWAGGSATGWVSRSCAALCQPRRSELRSLRAPRHVVLSRSVLCCEIFTFYLRHLGRIRRKKNFVRSSYESLGDSVR